MEMRKPGKICPPLTAIGFGCMGLTGCYGPTERSKMIDLVREAYDLGIAFFDTAPVYADGANEELVGEAIAPFRSKIFLGTKFGMTSGENGQKRIDSEPAKIRASVETSLKRLRTDYIDLLYQHRVDPDVPIEEVAETVASLIKEGKVRYFGLSEPSMSSLKKANAVYPVAVIQNEYSLWYREPEKEVLPTLAELGIGLIPFSPLGRGYLAGKMDGKTELSPQDMRHRFPRFTPEAMEANRGLVELLQKIAASKNATPAQIALAWLLAQKPWIVPIPGTTKIERLKENLGALKIMLTPEELEELNKGSAAIKLMGNRYNAVQSAEVNR